MLCYDKSIDRTLLRKGAISLELISKKQLLAETGISYGQLYRWKRERLIPEGWFIKQSSYTGQETFFPKEQMLARVQAILEAKDRYSLEELAKILSPEAVDVPLAPRELWEWGEIGPDLLAAAEAAAPPAGLSFDQAVLLAALWEGVQRLSLPPESAKDLVYQALALPPPLRCAEGGCTLFRCGGELTLAVTGGEQPPLFGPAVSVLDSRPMSELAGRIKMKYTARFESGPTDESRRE